MYKPELETACNELLKIASSIKIKFDGSDDLQFMTLCFFQKQVDHMRSTLTLLPSPDTQLIVRSMLEGLVYLLWAIKETTEEQTKETPRATRWRYYVYVEDKETLRKKMANDEYVSGEERLKVEQDFEVNKEPFLTKSKMKCHSNWKNGKNLAEIFKEVSGDDLYALYSVLSDYHHFGAKNFASQASFRPDNKFEFDPNLDAIVNTSLSLAFQCLYQTLEQADFIFELGISKDLKAVYSYLLKECKIPTSYSPT